MVNPKPMVTNPVILNVNNGFIAMIKGNGPPSQRAAIAKNGLCTIEYPKSVA